MIDHAVDGMTVMIIMGMVMVMGMIIAIINFIVYLEL